MKGFRICALAIGFVIAFSGALFADPITFTFTGSGTGTIGDVGFTDAGFVITAFGDTANRQALWDGYFIDHDSASINIDNVGAYDIQTGTRTFMNNATSTFGFSRSGLDGLDLFNGQDLIAAWDMLTSVGPVAGTMFLMQWSDPEVATDGGVLYLGDDPGVQGTFSASVKTAVPEPSSLLLLSAGLGVLGLLPGKKRLSD